ncbi:MAG: ferritin [Flavobacteriales bacterium]|jgi:ferritin
MMKILEYIFKRVAELEVIAIPTSSEDPVVINNNFEKVFEHKVDNKKAIYKLLKLSHNGEED